ncbi:glycoside hydrolase family 97 protein [Pontibacter chitinilyticus]|uniref:glycoside hydrolase family 97 protein n=1 Tax=Pontibacter chitinilyticus TaxID=2674989 RepID=UPI00321B97E6
MKQKLLLLILLISSGYVAAAQQTGNAKSYTLQSPDGKVKVKVMLQDTIMYTVQHEGDVMLAPSPMALLLQNGDALGVQPHLKSIKNITVNETIAPPIYKRATIQDNYNQMVLHFKDDYSIIFRAYNEGVAYRFATSKKNDFQVKNEVARFNFTSDYPAFVPYVKLGEKTPIEEQFFNSFENTYTHAPISQLDPQRLAFLPLVVEEANDKKLAITEADLEDYPGMYLLQKPGSTALQGVFAPYPKTVEQGGHNELQMLVKERENYIARAEGTRVFPWRVLIIASDAKELLDSDMVYKLASPSRLKDTSWIKPGKVAWDWWNDWNISGVDFKSGINNDTYEYYIDFASENKIPYVILDEGWAVNKKADLMQVVPEIDLKELIDYGKKKNVGIILWAGYHAFDRDMEKVAKHYADMGVKGFKVDFMDRDDQQVVDFYYRAAATGAKNKLLMDFHGAYKPTGLQRTYPNVINSEGVHGLEQMKWATPDIGQTSVDQVTYDVTIPFIRMVAGPMDYTQGAMRNATKNNFRAVNSEPMSQGTRARQLAEYVVFESPVNMLADSPTNYKKEMESTAFIAAVPETWDETKALSGKIGEYVAIARRKGKEWYVGAMTNWDARKLELDLSFLGDGAYEAEVMKDGINADRKASDYKHEIIAVPQDRKLHISMAPGGGYVARIYKK